MGRKEAESTINGESISKIEREGGKKGGSIHASIAPCIFRGFPI